MTDEEREREIALGDRRAALDGLVQSVSWLIGTALLLNGGGLLAILDQSDLPITVATVGPFTFLFGLFSAILAAVLTGHYAVRLMDRANVVLKRLPEKHKVNNLRWQVALISLIGFCLIGSYGFFGIGATNALKVTAEARLEALKAETAGPQSAPPLLPTEKAKSRAWKT